MKTPPFKLPLSAVEDGREFLDGKLLYSIAIIKHDGPITTINQLDKDQAAYIVQAVNHHARLMEVFDLAIKAGLVPNNYLI